MADSFCQRTVVSSVARTLDHILGPFLTRKFFQEILGLEGSKKFLEKNRQVHNLRISDCILRSKKFLVGKYSWFYVQRIS